MKRGILQTAIALAAGMLGGAKVPESNTPASKGKEAPAIDNPSKGFYGSIDGVNQRQRRKRAAQVRGG